MRYVLAPLLLLACACSNPGMRVGVELEGKRFYEAQGEFDPAYDVLCVAGTGVTSLEVTPRGESWLVRWGQTETTFDADLVFLNDPNSDLFVEGAEIPSLRLLIALGQDETWPLQVDVPLVLEFDVGGGVTAR